MPSSRRALLRAGLLGLTGSLAGCAGDDRSARTRTTDRTTDEATVRTTIGKTSDSAEPTEKTTEPDTTTARASDDRRALEFAHRGSVLDWGVQDASTWYYARVFADEWDARQLDLSNAGGDVVAGAEPELVERFVAETDFRASSLLVVQADVASSRFGLKFDFLDWNAAPPQVVGHVESHDREATTPATSTLLVRVPAEVASQVRVTLVERDGRKRSETLHVTETFAPPNRTLFETVTVETLSGSPSDELPVPGGALVTTPTAARRFAPEDAPFGDFVRGTDFDRSYLLAVQMRMGSNGYRLWPTDVVSDDSAVFAQLRRGFGGGLNAEFTTLTLARVFAETAPERGTAIVSEYDDWREHVGTRTIALSHDPGDWQRATPTTADSTEDPTTRGGNRS